MKFIQGQNRNQINLFPVSLDQSIDPDNEVRLIDLFVESLSLKESGFRTDFPENGRPAFHPSDMLKHFICGYLNKIRSSRELEKECAGNIEVIQEEIKKQQERKAGYKELEKNLKNQNSLRYLFQILKAAGS